MLEISEKGKPIFFEKNFSIVKVASDLVTSNFVTSDLVTETFCSIFFFCLTFQKFLADRKLYLR